MAQKSVAPVSIDAFPEKALWRGVKLDPGELWVANHPAPLALRNLDFSAIGGLLRFD